MSHPAHYREAHPFAAVMNHWVHLVSIIALAFSGFYIHYPFFPGFMGVARGMHFFFMYLLIINLVIRIILAFTMKSANVSGNRETDLDIKNFLPQKANRGKLFPQMAFYAMAKKEHPTQGKYNPLQKMAYIFVPILVVAMAWTGFSLYGPYMDNSFFQASVRWVGGPMNMRIIHYFLMWAFIIFTAVHAYMARIFGASGLEIMLRWKESEGLEFDKDGKITGKSKA